MDAKRWMMAAAAFCLLTGCAVQPTTPVARIALLAPFEGRYREIGYDLLYAARLALKDAGYTHIELLPIDYGGGIETAVERAEALALNPLVMAVLVAGNDVVDARVQQAFADVPVIVVGHWSAQPTDEDVFMLASAELGRLITAPQSVEIIEAADIETPVTGGEIFALKNFPNLRESLEGITVVTSAALPDAAFIERYITSDLFVQSPGLLVTLGYDATRMAADAVATADHRQAVTTALEQMNYSGLNGLITFEDGYWLDAPVIEYRYNRDGDLTPIE